MIAINLISKALAPRFMLVFMHKLAALGLFLFSPALAAPLTVWLPQQGQEATLSPAGLVGAAGNHIKLYSDWSAAPQSQPLAQGFARLTYAKSGEAHLEVVQRGKVTASRFITRSVRGMWGTQRGPCLLDTGPDNQNPLFHCYAPNLKQEWAKFAAPSQEVFVKASGEAAYFVKAEWESKQPYHENVVVIRYDLKTASKTTLNYHVGNSEYYRNMAEQFGVRNTIHFGAELPNGRYLICVTLTMPRLDCNLEIVDRNLKTLVKLQGNGWPYIPQVSKDGRKILVMDTLLLRVWDAKTGQFLVDIRNPVLAKQQEDTVTVLMTPDSQKVAMINCHFDSQTGCNMKKLTAYIYRLNDVQLLSKFALKP